MLHNLELCINIIFIYDLEFPNHWVIITRETIWLLLEAHIILMLELINVKSYYGNDIQNTGAVSDVWQNSIVTRIVVLFCLE